MDQWVRRALVCVHEDVGQEFFRSARRRLSYSHRIIPDILRISPIWFREPWGRRVKSYSKTEMFEFRSYFIWKAIKEGNLNHFSLLKVKVEESERSLRSLRRCMSDLLLISSPSSVTIPSMWRISYSMEAEKRGRFMSLCMAALIDAILLTEGCRESVWIDMPEKEVFRKIPNEAWRTLLTSASVSRGPGSSGAHQHSPKWISC